MICYFVLLIIHRNSIFVLYTSSKLQFTLKSHNIMSFYDYCTYDIFIILGINLGSKALGCFGGCDLHGKPRVHRWVHLQQTADVGSSTIVVTQDVGDWNVGNEIVITTTGYRFVAWLPAIPFSFTQSTVNETLSFFKDPTKRDILCCLGPTKRRKGKLWI